MDIETVKKCSCCGHTKPNDGFGVRETKPDGSVVLLGVCKKCKAEQVRLRRAKSGDAREGHRLSSQRYRLKNLNLVNARRRANRVHLTEEQHEIRRAYMREYIAKNKHKIADKRTPEKIREDSRNYYLRKAEAIKSKVSEYRRANKNKIRSWWNTRRSREKVGVLSSDITDKLLVLQKWRCACCRKSLKGGFHLDHIVPLSKGGLNVNQNVQLLTPECNLRKSAKDPITYMQEKGFLL